MDHPISLRIASLAFGGDAVARADDGRTVFVAGGCPGDLVTAQVTADHGRYLQARVVDILDPSPDRRTPPCPYFAECGGCQWQHVSHQAQVTAKRDAVTEALRRIADIPDPCVADVVTGGAAYGYRNKIELSAATDARGRLILGLAAAGSHRIVPIDACLLLPEKVRAYPKALGGALRYLSRGDGLGLRRVAVRCAENTGSVEVDLWAAPGPFPRGTGVRTLSSAVKFDSLTRVLTRGDGTSRDVAKVEVLSGHGYWRERLSGLEFRVSAPSFFQINSSVTELLSSLVVSELAADGSDRVLDLYAGVGTFTLPIADVAGEVVAIESAGAAVRDLRRNLDLAGLEAEVSPGDAARVLEDEEAFDLAVVDPPRSGLPEDVTNLLASLGPRRIVYVSCDPATLARDAGRLRSLGYTFVRATPVDLFPQTFHVEAVAVFDRDR